MVLRIGQRVPDFSLPDTEKKERRLSEFTQKGKTVLLFFPFAFSGPCDKEMCVFRDGMVKINSMNVQVVGISVDSLFTLKVFAQTYNLQFPLLSDFNKKVSKAYGVLHETWVAFGYKGVSKRAALVLDGKGILRYKWVTDTPSNEPPYEEIMAALNKL
ncbi:MAG: peroxiredoxin [Thaumarchaeota archaeon]|nr:peroxiredoxin [Nitrososphaerota archaeon]